MSRLLVLLIMFASMQLAAMAQDQAAQEEKSRQDWLRYSNWEHRSQKPRHNTESGSKTDPGSAADRDLPAGSNKAPARLPLPENPGSQTVEGSEPSVPGWAFQPAPQLQRSPQIMVGADSLGSRPGFLAQPYGWNYAGSNPYYWGSGPFLGYQPFSSGLKGSWGARNYWGSPWAAGLLPYRAWQSGSRLASEVIETGPSPASGNYYQPSSVDASASGNYYAGAAPWQVPLNAPSTPKDYWGPGGSPFK